MKTGCLLFRYEECRHVNAQQESIFIITEINHSVKGSQTLTHLLRAHSSPGTLPGTSYVHAHTHYLSRFSKQPSKGTRMRKIRYQRGDLLEVS